MVCLIGVIGIIIALVDGLVAQHTDLVVVFTGSFINPLIIIEGINRGSQILLGDGSVDAQIINHQLKDLTGLYHGQVIFFLAD